MRQMIYRNKQEDEIDKMYGDFFDAAMEAVAKRIIPHNTKTHLPDTAFGIPKYRKYPLIVEGDPEKTAKLIKKTIKNFHYCRPDWKEELSNNILKACEKTNTHVEVGRASALFAYCQKKKIPKCVKII